MKSVLIIVAGSLTRSNIDFPSRYQNRIACEVQNFRKFTGRFLIIGVSLHVKDACADMIIIISGLRFRLIRLRLQ